MDSIDVFDHHSESDPDVVFYKNTIFSAYCSKCCFFHELTHIQVLIKKMYEAKIIIIFILLLRLCSLF